MKLYTPHVLPYILRVNIKKAGTPTEHLSFVETEPEELLDYIKYVIKKQNLSPFIQGKVTNIEIRESLPPKSEDVKKGRGRESINGKSISCCFKGLEPLQVKNLIIESLKTQNIL